MVDNDAELMDALFVSDDGELRVEPEWDWDQTAESGWFPVTVPEPVAAGILRLIRERDEARHVAEAYAEPHSEKFAPPWGVKP